MGTVHEDAAQDGVDDFLRRGGGAMLMELHDALEVGAFHEGFRRAFGDWTWRGQTYAQMYSFLRIDGLMRHRHAALIRVKVGAEPGADRCREQNAAALADLRHPFVAHLDMHQNNAEDDGTLEWTEPIRVKLYPNGSGANEYVMVPPASIPLEVGSSAPSKAFMHLAQYGAVARWPYGEEHLYVLTGVPEPSVLSTGLREGEFADALGVPGFATLNSQPA